jgi:hypothetical protein
VLSGLPIQRALDRALVDRQLGRPLKNGAPFSAGNPRISSERLSKTRSKGAAAARLIAAAPRSAFGLGGPRWRTSALERTADVSQTLDHVFVPGTTGWPRVDLNQAMKAPDAQSDHPLGVPMNRPTLYFRLSLVWRAILAGGVAFLWFW